MSIEQRVKDMFYDPAENGIHMVNMELEANKVGLANKDEVRRFEKEVSELLGEPKINPYVQLQKWRKLGKQMFKIVELHCRMTDGMKDQLDRISSTTSANANKRWSKEDDELLIDMVCREDVSLIEIASIFGRSPNAISTRVSYLVGVNRLSEEIAGNFIGKLNGEEVQGEIKGTLNKK